MTSARRWFRRPARRMSSVLAFALLIPAVALAGVTVVADQTAAVAATSPQLTVGPASYVGGQRLTWTGNVGHAGVRSLRLQFNMGSVVGNHWTTVEGFGAHTRA